VIGRAEHANALTWVGFGSAQALGASFLSVNLFNTLLIRQGASDFVLGLFALPQLLAVPSQALAAHLADRTRNKVRLVQTAVLLQILPILLPGAVLWLVGASAGLWVLFGAIFGYYVLSALGGTIGSVAQMDLLSRVFRPHRRGTIFGFQGSMGGLAGALGGLTLAAVMSRVEYPGNYLSSWTAAVVLVSAASLLLLRLRPLPGLQTRRRPGETPSLRRALAVLSRDRPFLVLLIAVVARMGFSAASFYAWPMAKRLHQLPDEYVGYLVTLSSVVMMVVQPGIGWLADNLGRGRTALVFSAVAAAGFASFPAAPGTALLACAYGLMLVGTQGVTMPLFLSVLDLSPPESRGAYVAVRYGTESLVYAGFLPLFGLLSTTFRPAVIFYAGAALCLLAGGILFRVGLGRPAPADTVPDH